MKFIRSNLKSRLDVLRNRINWLPHNRRNRRRVVVLRRLQSSLWRDIHELRRRDHQASVEDYRGWTLEPIYDSQPQVCLRPGEKERILDQILDELYVLEHVADRNPSLARAIEYPKTSMGFWGA